MEWEEQSVCPTAFATAFSPPWLPQHRARPKEEKEEEEEKGAS